MLKPQNRSLLFLILIIIVSIYYFINRPIGSVHNLALQLDDRIPLIPIFSLPYIAMVPIFAIMLVYAFFANKSFIPLAISTIIIFLISYLFYIFFQTKVDRPMIDTHQLFSQFVSFIYRHDQPYNAFPSLHVAMATITIQYFHHIKSKWLLLLIIYCALVILATLFVKQHYLVDVLAGFAISFLVCNKVFKTFK